MMGVWEKKISKKQEGHFINLVKGEGCEFVKIVLCPQS